MTFNLLRFKLILFSFTTLLISVSVSAQTTITTNYTTYGSGSGGTTNATMLFVIQNTNPGAIILTDVGYWISANQTWSGTMLWYKASPLQGAPGAITVANGWTQIGGTQTTTTTTEGYYPVRTNLNFTIPANTSYRFALAAGNNSMIMGSSTCVPNIFTATGVNLLVGNHQAGGTGDVGFWGPFSSPFLSPWFFRGFITFEDGACSGVPNSGTVQSSAASVVCGGTVNLSLSGHTNSTNITYQWQRNTGTGWTNFGTSIDAITSPAITQNTQFRCQVTCTSIGGGTATTNPISIFVTPISINIGNDTTICPGITQTLDATNVAGSAYLWTPGNLTTPTRNINSAGSYRVRVTQPNGCIGRDTIIVTDGLQPTNFLDPSYNLCADSTITLDAGNAVDCDFLWTPTSATTQTITINNGGNYSVLITSVDNCELVSATNVVYRPRPVLMLPPVSTICSVDSVLIDATTPLGHTYSWSTGATTPSIYAKDSIIYYVTVTSEFGCPSWDNTKVEYFPNPTTEGFTFIPYFYEQLGKVTFAPINPQAVNSYRWYFGDGDSSYQRTPTHVYKGSGIYLVTLVVVNHCIEQEYTQNVHINLPTGIITTDKDMEVSIYPNPATEKVTIENKSNQKLTAVQVYNAVGAVVYQSDINNDTHEINLSGLASGIYHIRVQADNNNWMVKKIEISK